MSHDLILNKLKKQYGIDGNLLKLLVNYLQGRKQRVVLDNIASESITVLSGVPQGSILGPLLFLLFINDIYTGIDKETNIVSYADDTKMWRRIKSELDCEIFQKDIDTLVTWSIKNKMKFHPGKCKVVQICETEPLCTKVLPMAKFYYTINENIIDYTDSERDLGIWVNSKFKWDQQQESVLNKAHQMLGIIKCSCNFIADVNKRQFLYISLVRSQFEHWSIIWRLHNETEISGFEKLQKKAIKWIFNEHIQHYDDKLYLNRCSQVNLIPMLAFLTSMTSYFSIK